MTDVARYDRQLRIWGPHGQQRLENAQLCVLKAGPCGSEVLKNLVLGGIGSFTLIDDAAVMDEDFGKNYLVDVKGQGTSLAQVVCRLLGELNENVHGTPIEESPGELIFNRPEFFRDFSLIIAAQLSSQSTKALAEICREGSIPLIVLQSYGLLGSMKMYVKEACVIESKPDDEVPDLRLGDPWPALATFADSFKFESMEDVEHSHVPYVVILLKAAEKWREDSQEKIPKTDEQKRAFRSTIQDLRRTEKKAGIEEENFAEASRAAYQFWTPYSIAQSMKEVLEDDCIEVTRESTAFWIVAAALKKFFDDKGVLPLSGAIPDMTATTESYLKLQTIYSNKACEDIEQVTQFVKEILEKLGMPEDHVPQSMVTLMCKNARNLRIVRSWPSHVAEDPKLLSYLRSQETFRNAGYALLLEAAEVFHQTHARAPGDRDGEEWTEDVALLMKACQGIADLGQLEQELQSELQSMALEICRFRGGELHNVSAVMGGIAAQEAIKLLTQQFVPFKGTLFYNAMDSTTTRF